MKTYFTFGMDRLHNKNLEGDMERHMHASHMKAEIPKARILLNQLKKYDKAHRIPHGNYKEIEICKSGIYLKNGGYKLKLDLRKAS
ncbi:MAG: hypothetical protein HY606_14020 [Planctomycetes bacterium]|nr:hypothetical protein [Planctomycetota bacterium]